MTKRLFLPGLLLTVAIALRAAEPGTEVVVVYNRNLPGSKQLAEYYAARRHVPAGQLFGVDVSATAEVMTRGDFREKLEQPVFDWLVAQKLFTPNPRKKSGATDAPTSALSGAKIRYLVLSYGIPLKIARDGSVREELNDKVQEALRGRNEAAVDADLALLPVSQEKVPLTGPLISPYYLTTNPAALHPTNGLLLVARLDGPTVEIARGLVDKALQAETDGLWGRAYIDSRGITNGDYQLGDDWMRASAMITRRLGFETVLDEKETLFPATFPLSQIAFYVGWYDGTASGPFAQPTVEFMPGAFAYHLHSYSAVTIRSTNQAWVGPLLARGATITMGSVDEPYLSGTPNVAAFLERLIHRRFTFGEAAYASQSALSWQTTVVGDPLYRPFGETPEMLHRKLESSHHPLLEWSHLRVIGLNEAGGVSTTAEIIRYLDQIPETKTSAVLQEKLGNLQRASKKLSAAAETYAAAVKLQPSPQQKIRLLLEIGELQTLLGREPQAYDAYLQLVTDAPLNPNAALAYGKLATLARKLGKKDEAEKFTQEAQRLSAAPR